MSRLLVFGSSGQLAQELIVLAHEADREVRALGRAELDLADPALDLDAAIAESVADFAPDAVVNASGYTAVDRAESEPDAAHALNADLPARAARACAEAGVPLVHISTDYVFDGSKPAPYVETDPLAPLGVYGRTKAEGEAAVAAAGGRAAAVRTAWVYGAEGANFVRTMLRLAADRDEVAVVADQQGNPTWAGDVALACLRLGDRLIAGAAEAQGVFHAAGEGDATWAQFAAAVFAESAARGGPTARVRPIPTADYPTPATRPANSRLDCARLARTTGWRPPPWRERLVQVVAKLV